MALEFQKPRDYAGLLLYRAVKESTLVREAPPFQSDIFLINTWQTVSDVGGSFLP